ncbi:hypothetical protein FHS18_005491 [Paenibacillus phyllosphaerae]|uniref:Uncharacterized protein n=1 Tax=Paenibacillus phyllosphaerae TaxID=274593 RepID=A0A7W5B3A4_9BACL|nr:hypothetical protein [Paenibacillus phyllosphaerae]
MPCFLFRLSFGPGERYDEELRDLITHQVSLAFRLTINETSRDNGGDLGWFGIPGHEVIGIVDEFGQGLTKKTAEIFLDSLQQQNVRETSARLACSPPPSLR